MSQEATFIYRYSATENKEIQDIRNKYLPKKESKLEELKRLDNAVQSCGVEESLCAGIGGALVFGAGLCLAMQIIGSGVISIIFGVLLGIVGACGMLAAYPLYRRILEKKKAQLAPRILELADELSAR